MRAAENAGLWERIKFAMNWLLDDKYFTAIMTIVTIWALFGDDIRLLATEKPADDAFVILTMICLFGFCLELREFQARLVGASGSEPGLSPRRGHSLGGAPGPALPPRLVGGAAGPGGGGGDRQRAGGGAGGGSRGAGPRGGRGGCTCRRGGDGTRRWR